MFTGAELKDWVIIVAGNVFIVVLVVRMISHWAKREWGDLLTNALVAVFIAWIVYSTDTFIKFLRWLANKVTGGQSGSTALGAHHAPVLDAGHALALHDGAAHVAALLGAGLI